MAKKISNTKISRTIYPRRETDEAIKKLAEEYGESINGTYKNLVDLGLVVETVAHMGGEVTVTLPNKTSFKLAGPQGAIRPRFAKIFEDGKGES